MVGIRLKLVILNRFFRHLILKHVDFVKSILNLVKNGLVRHFLSRLYSASCLLRLHLFSFLHLLSFFLYIQI